MSLKHQTIQCLSGLVVGLSLLTLPTTATWAALRLSDPVGVQDIGKPIDLRSTVSGIPQGAESQLRSTCLRGRIKPMETLGAASLSSEVMVGFQPTVKQGGVIEIRSRVPVNHALVQVEINSDCPLVVFRNTWTLIMNEHSATLQNAAAAPEQPAGQSAFDAGNSLLLQQSRRAPVRASVAQHEPAPLKNPVSKIQKPNNSSSGSAPVVPQAGAMELPEEPVKVASLDQRLINNGLIPSQQADANGYGGLGVDDLSVKPQSFTGALTGSIPDSGESWLLLGSIALLIVSLLAWAVARLRPKSMFSLSSTLARSARQPGKFAAHERAMTPTPVEVLQGEPVRPQAVRFGADRVLESLIDIDDSSYQDEDLPLESDNGFGSVSSADKDSVNICVELCSRADIRSWDLPASFQPLVAERNKVLEMHRTSEAMILRCHIGLVELAYQEARLGRILDVDKANELLQLLLGEHVYQLEECPALAVPDVLKSYTKVKLCDIVGSENRRVLRDNLLNLNGDVASQALCFGTNAWREFLSDEGAIGHA